MRFTSKVTIQAPIDKVWAIVSAVNEYPTWNSGVTKVEGSAMLGSKIKLYSEVSPGKAFPLKVATLETNKNMTLIGGMPFGLFRGIRTYALTGRGGTVDLVMSEEYSGPLASLVTKSIPDLAPSFDKFTKNLKIKAESQ